MTMCFANVVSSLQVAGIGSWPDSDNVRLDGLAKLDSDDLAKNDLVVLR